MEAITTATGADIAYVGARDRNLHWISGGVDRDLNVRAASPVFNAAATALYFLIPEGALHSITRTAASSQEILPGPSLNSPPPQRHLYRRSGRPNPPHRPRHRRGPRMGEPPPALSWNWSPEFVGSCLLGCPSPYIVTPYARCHRMLSDDFSTVLTSQSQGNRGDLVHVLLSGLENQPLPKLAGTYQAEYFASAPGLIALQQFGIRILGNNPQTDSCSPIETTAASAKCPKPASPESYDEDEAL